MGTLRGHSSRSLQAIPEIGGHTLKKTWLAYDAIADVYEYDMGQNMPFDDVGYYVRHAAQAEGEVLELGCGTGRITLSLLRGTLSVTAVDASARMLRRLQRSHADLPIDGANRLRLIQMDLRRWALRGKFATILCPYSLLTYFVEPSVYSSFLDDVRESLLDGGQFICDAFIPSRRIPFGQTIRDYERHLPDGSVLSRSKVIVPDGVEGVYGITRHYQRIREPHIRECFTTSERIRPWHPDALEIILRRHSFDIRALDFDYESTGGEASARFATFRCGLKI
jgi:SAM-dependent methyltransferase